MSIKKLLERLIRPLVSKKALALFLISFFLVSILPLLILSFYNRMAADDYSYSVLTVHAWRETGSIFQVLTAAFQTVKSYYFSWQGTFSAVFLFSLQPAIFGSHFYFLTTFLMLGMLILSTGYLLNILLVQYLKTDRWTWLIVTTIVLFLSIQLVPNANETFYWYNGSVYYTFFYSVMLFMVGLILELANTSSKGWFIFRSIIIVLLAIFISGGNYSTALISCILLAFFSTIFFIRKKKVFWVVANAFFVAIIGLLVSGLAPGNSIRAAYFISTGPINAIIHSLYSGLVLFSQWANLVVFGIMIFLFPFVLGMVSRVQFSFKYPVLVILGSYALFSAQMSPTFFVMNSLGPDRLIDVYYFTFILMIVLNFIYLVGWLNKKALGKETFLNGNHNSVSIGFLLIVVTIAFVGLLNRGIAGLKAIPTINAAISVINGDARAFRFGNGRSRIPF